ncbi:MAG TPA: acetoin dehydrogenase dihydrolipoyllysine-residue acetyltransferase subunit [Caulobacteraceae bacterium]|nr:acetoin dehydrogenase dihydrolipoyllysine-residue acetyltransferase subunit [Caulobacteraceae bacterium]
MTAVTPIRMPKWGLSMQEGQIVEWSKREGERVSEGEDLVEIETSKITNVYESPATGELRRIVAQPGETLPVGALIAVLAEADITDAAVESFIADFQASFVPEDADADAGALRLSTVRDGERSLRVGRAGPEAGEPVVLIHGYAGDLNSWQFNIDALAAKAPVVAIDLPGHGGSSKDVGDGSLASLADAVGQVLSALAVERAHLVGHSLGAGVAAWLAAERPGLALSLTLVCPAYLPGIAISEDFVSGLIGAQRARELRPCLEMLLADPAAVSRDMIDDMLAFKRTDGVEEALSTLRDRMLSGADAAALQARLGDLPPTLVIASRGDRIVGAPDEALLPPQLKVAWIEGAGHLPHLEQPGAFNALLLEAIA